MLPGFYISAAHKSSGKTTMSLGLCRALRDKGHIIAPFKKGPDYIDPLWLSQSAGNNCYNLDFYTQSNSEICTLFHQHAHTSDLAIVEGNKGLYDGLDLDGANSNAAMAKQLGLPVVLVIDVSGVTRGIAPLLLGYQAFDEEIDFAGVILNKVATDRHEQKLRAVVEHFTDIPVLGAVRRNSSLDISERHLGLIPSNESSSADARIQQISEIVAEQVDLDYLVQISRQATPLQIPHVQGVETVDRPFSSLKIGIAQDKAFGFYYADDLARFKKLGAELVPFDTLNDKRLPDVHGVFIGGGFPETSAPELENNSSMRASIRSFVEAGGPLYAECGGLMYLCKSIAWGGETWEMAGVIDTTAQMNEKPQGRGYVKLQFTSEFPWFETDVDRDHTISAHEFHYSALSLEGHSPKFGYRVVRGKGVDGLHDGIIYKKMFASYTHLRSSAQFDWVSSFLAFVQRCTTPG